MLKTEYDKQGNDFSNLITIHNGISPDDLKINISPEKLRQKYGLDSSIRIFGIIGNIKPWKGQKTVVEAIYRLKQSFAESFVCFFVGAAADESKHYEIELRELVKRYELHNNVIFTGYVKNPADFINLFQIVIHASILPEPFGRVLLEAMALKKAVIATNIGGPLEIIVHGESGLLVEPSDADSLKDSILFLLTDDAYRRKIGKSAYNRMRNYFSIEKNVKSTELIYESLLENRNNFSCLK